MKVLAQKPIEIDCEEVWRNISNYLDKEVDPQLRFNLEAHFKDCAHCSAILGRDPQRSEAGRRWQDF